MQSYFQDCFGEIFQLCYELNQLIYSKETGEKLFAKASSLNLKDAIPTEVVVYYLCRWFRALLVKGKKEEAHFVMHLMESLPTNELDLSLQEMLKIEQAIYAYCFQNFAKFKQLLEDILPVIPVTS